MAVILDTTLREGEQTPGVSFSLAEKKKIIDGLVRIGINEIELGIASVLIDCPVHLIRYCRTIHPGVRCLLWSRCLEKDIRFAATLKPDIIYLSLPVSDILIREKLGRNREWTAKQLVTCLELASKLGLTVAVGFEDATRAEPEFLLSMAKLAEAFGAERLRLADTLGSATPMEIAHLVSTVSKALRSCQIGIHCHNDFGMATANAVTALENGATCTDATLLGLGERCGCTRLEEIAGFLRLKKNTPFDIAAIPPLSRYISGLTKKAIPANQPFIGKEIFTCETGLHLQALQKNPATYEPYSPELIGAERKLIVGKKAGRKALLSHLRKHGYSIDNDNIDDAAMKEIRLILTQNNPDIPNLLTRLGCC